MRRFDLTGNHTERVGEKQKFGLQQQEKLSFCDKTMRNVLMNLWLRKSVIAVTVGWVGYSALYPFLQDDPLQQAKQLDAWQQPSTLTALNDLDQKKLLARLTYPDPLPDVAEVPDFNSIKDTSERKRAFIDYLTPFVERENARLLKLRMQVLDLQDKVRASEKLTVEEYAFVYSLFDEFKLDMADVDDAGLKELLARVDVIPTALVLTQAAIESGWGSSRFAVEGYNFFGQWCFKAGCGVVPSKRAPGKYHEVSVFPHAAASIKAYFYNINTFYMYDNLRQIRAQMRQTDGNITTEKLVAGLSKYSERGHHYVTEVTSMVQATQRLLEES